MTATAGAEGNALLHPYAPRVLLEWLHKEPSTTHRLLEGSVVFADISGFTKLSERLAGRGRVGAEELTDAINTCFERLLAVAYDDGASLLKFGGDATLLLFTGDEHAFRATRAAAAMRQALRDLGAFDASGHKVTLRISIGVHTGTFTAFLVGDSHRELLLTGPAFTRVVDMESTAEAGEVVISPETAAELPRRAVGKAKGPGFLLAGTLPGDPGGRVIPLQGLEPGTVATALSTAVRTHLGAGVDEPEHRRVTIAFLHFDHTDQRIVEEGPAALAADLDVLVRQVQESADKHGVCFLGTDVDHDGGKIILVAGAPNATGEDEQRMLLALRAIVESKPPVPLRIGVNAGPVFVGSVGPFYRRTYTVMGDAVNLAARVMAKAAPGQLLSTETVLERSTARFATAPLEPFMVKGKAHPVVAHEVGPPLSATEPGSRRTPPLVGRDGELSQLLGLMEQARAGTGVLVDVVGEAGLGKTRLVDELVRRTPDVRVLSTSCAAYQSLSPYWPFQTLLRAMLDLPDSASPREAGDRLLSVLHERAPDLLPWAPLIAIPLAAEVPSTPEVDKLGERFVTSRLQNVVTFFIGVMLDGPTLVVVDDVHWSDDASADLLRRVVRDIPNGPWLMVVTRRPDAGGFVPEDAAHVVTVPTVALAGGSALELAEALVDAESGAEHLSPHDLATLVSRSGGSPLYLAELVASAAAAGGIDELPDTVEALVMARIDRLAPADRALLRRLSVFGQSCDHDLLSATLDDAPGLDDAVWQRIAEVVGVDGSTVRFEHGLVRDAAYGSLPFRVRQELHSQIGATLEARATDPDAVASLLSLHFFNAHLYDAAWRYSRSAATTARSVHANVEAAEMYERAASAARLGAVVEPTELAAVLEAAGDVHSRLGKFSKADHAYRGAARHAPSGSEDEVRLLLKRGELRERFGHYPAALRWLSRARRLANRMDSEIGSRYQGLICMAFALVAKDQARHRDAITWCQRAIAVAGLIRDKATLAHAYSVHDGSCSVLGRFDQAQFGERSLALYTELGDLRGQGMAHSNLGLLEIMRGRFEEGLEHWEKSQAALRLVGDEVNVAVVSVNVGEARLDQGRLDDAEGYLRQANRVSAAAGDLASVAWAGRLLARVEARRGNLVAALERFEQVRSIFQSVQAEEEALETQARVAEAYVISGRTDEAFALATQLLADPHDLSQLHGLLFRVLGFAHAQRGETDVARECFERSLEAAQQAEADIETGQTLRAISRLVTGTELGDALKARSEEIFALMGVVEPLDPPMASPVPLEV